MAFYSRKNMSTYLLSSIRSMKYCNVKKFDLKIIINLFVLDFPEFGKNTFLGIKTSCVSCCEHDNSESYSGMKYGNMALIPKF